MSKPTNFRDLRSSFESRSKPTTAATLSTSNRRPSTAEDLANMSSDKPTKVVPSIAQSIDSVLATQPAAKPSVRPPAKLRPSWIGPPRPERPTTPGMSAMRQHASVEYSSPGLQPPVYICTSLSDPQWDAIEMQTEKKDGGEYRFFKSFDVEEGEYQYKFRLGPGDWWACDESRPTVDDGMGNKNNLLAVKPELSKPAAEHSESKVVTSATAPKPPAMLVARSDPEMHPIMTPAPQETFAPTPLMKHETFLPNKGSASQQTPEHEANDPLATEVSPDDAESPSLMKHETSQSNAEDDTSSATDDGDDSSSSDSEDDEPSSPLLRHESVAPSSAEQNHAPLFRHESIAIGYNHHESPAATMSPSKLSRKASGASSIPAEADPHDPSLEKFPTDHAGIIEKIHRTSTSLAADETSDDIDHASPHSQALSESSISVPSLPSVREAEDEELERIREAEEEEVEKEEASGEEMDPLRPAAPMTPPLTPEEPEDADFEPKVPETEKIEINETIVIEVVEERRHFFETLLEKLGGKGNALALAVGLLVVAASIATMQYL